MKPTTISENMMFNTTRLISSDGSSGTGFFFNYKFDDTIVPTLITNKHVINNNPSEPMKLMLHLRENDGSSNENINIQLHTKWIIHPSKDICLCPINPIFEEIKTKFKKNVFYRTNDESIIWSNEKLKELSALEEVVMVGYPIGLWDETNNFPIFRKGITASHPAFDFNNENVGLVDMACFPGSSGSPIYILNENGYSDKKGNTYIGRNRLILLGILFAGPHYNARGEIEITDIPTQQKAISQTPVMINLGYYIKAIELLHFKPYLKKLLNE